MEDVLDLYAREHDEREPVVCLDEKSKQLLRDLLPVHEPTKPGQIRKRDHEYVRYGTMNIFAVVEPKGGKHHIEITPQRKRSHFARQIEKLSQRYPRARTIHLVMDNLNTHSETSLIQHFGEMKGRRLWKRFTIHYTPTPGSWLN